MQNKLTLAVVLAGIFTLSSWAEENKSDALAKELTEASVSLDQGLKTREQDGKPISGKYEINEEGALLLSIYTMTNGNHGDGETRPNSEEFLRISMVTRQLCQL